MPAERRRGGVSNVPAKPLSTGALNAFFRALVFNFFSGRSVFAGRPIEHSEGDAHALGAAQVGRDAVECGAYRVEGLLGVTHTGCLSPA